MDKIFELFRFVLDAHIKCKTTDALFHEKTQSMYELLFQVYHELGEKLIDTEREEGEKPDYKGVYEAIEDVKKTIEDMVSKKPTIGTDNLLRGLADKLEFECGNARAFINNYEKDDDDDYANPLK